MALRIASSTFVSEQYFSAAEYNKFTNYHNSLEYNRHIIVPRLLDKTISMYFPIYTTRTSTFHPLVGWTLLTNMNIDNEQANSFYIHKEFIIKK